MSGGAGPMTHADRCPEPPPIVRDTLTRHRDRVEWCPGCCRHGLAPTDAPEPAPLPVVRECLSCGARFVYHAAALRHAQTRGHEIARVIRRPYTWPHPDDLDPLEDQ